MLPHNIGLSVCPSYAAFLQFSDECAIVGRALTKTIIHSPLVFCMFFRLWARAVHK